jgi:hypothetical protein
MQQDHIASAAGARGRQRAMTGGKLLHLHVVAS